MKITIEYEASWRNSFLDDVNGNNKPLPKDGRKFIASMKSLKKPENFIQRDITLDTVMGVLNRLIGDQRKLYQSRSCPAYFFKNIEEGVMYADKPKVVNQEMTYIRNITGSNDQNSYTGMIKTHDPMFLSDYSSELWGILALDFDALCDFIIDDEKTVSAKISLNPLDISSRLAELAKVKPVESIGKAYQAMNILTDSFPDTKFPDNDQYLSKGMVVVRMMYCSALYLQLGRLAARFDMDSAKTKAGGISGISKRGFTPKDFMGRFTTGEKKKIWGNPYIHEQFIKGQGKTKHLMTKASGTLEIIIDVSRDKGKEIQGMIENAGVSSFYLGKKGLAYVSKISTREVS